MKIHVIITMIALFVFLIAAIWFSKKKYKINLSVLGLGAVAFFVSSQVLEKIVHLLVIHPQKDGTVPLMTENPLLYVIYGICMAALFEETARLVVFKSRFGKSPSENYSRNSSISICLAGLFTRC